jgi:hypothetical protein
VSLTRGSVNGSGERGGHRGGVVKAPPRRCHLVWNHFSLCAVPCAGLAFSVEERVEALRRAISRGHPVDLEALKALELKSRLVNSSYKYVQSSPLMLVPSFRALTKTWGPREQGPLMFVPHCVEYRPRV